MQTERIEAIIVISGSLILAKVSTSKTELYGNLILVFIGLIRYIYLRLKNYD